MWIQISFIKNICDVQRELDNKSAESWHHKINCVMYGQKTKMCLIWTKHEFTDNNF